MPIVPVKMADRKSPVGDDINCFSFSIASCAPFIHISNMADFLLYGDCFELLIGSQFDYLSFPNIFSCFKTGYRGHFSG